MCRSVAAVRLPGLMFFRRTPCACTACSALGLSLGACACRAGLQSTGGLGGCSLECPQARSRHARQPCCCHAQKLGLCRCLPRPSKASAGAVPGAAQRPATCARPRRAAGQQRVPEEIACVCSTTLGGLLACERVSERMDVGGAHRQHAMPVHHAAVDAATHRGAGARTGAARARRQQRRASAAHAPALAASSALCPAASKHVPVSASSAAAMCLQATHHRRPVHLRASCHACARGSVALTAKMVLLGARFCRPAHRRTGWLVVWQSALAPGPCGQPHPMPWLPRAERGRGERGLAGVVKHHVRARAAAHVREARPLPLALVAAGAPPHQRMPKGCAHPLRTAWLQAFTNKTS